MAALARNLFGFLRFIIGRRVRTEGNLHRVGKAQILKRANHLAHAHAAELALDRRGKAGVHLLGFIADRLDDVRDHRDVGDGRERAGDGAVAAGNALVVIDERAAVLLSTEIASTGRSARRAARIGDGVIRARLGAHGRTRGTYPG